MPEMNRNKQKRPRKGTLKEKAGVTVNRKPVKKVLRVRSALTSYLELVKAEFKSQITNSNSKHRGKFWSGVTNLNLLQSQI